MFINKKLSDDQGWQQIKVLDLFLSILQFVILKSKECVRITNLPRQSCPSRNLAKIICL